MDQGRMVMKKEDFLVSNWIDRFVVNFLGTKNNT